MPGIMSGFLMALTYSFDDFIISHFVAGPTAQTLPLCASGTAACFSTNLSLVEQLDQMGEQMNIFPLMDRGEPMVQRLSLLRHRQRYLTHFSKYFLELISNYCSISEQASISRAAGPMP